MSNKILVCDDDDGILDMLSLILKTKGFDVVTEMESASIFKRINSEKPDLILLDLWMPQLSGEEILKELKGNPETKGVPVVIISASRDGAEVARNSGADDFLEKPFDIRNLLGKIQANIRSVPQHSH